MEKVNIGPNVFTQPMSVTLLGTKTDNKVNFMTLAWVTRVNANPPLLAVAVNKMHHSAKGIMENETFSVNIPSEEMITETDYCGLVSGRTKDKSDLFNIFYGELKTAPLIKECPLSIECKLFNVIELPTNDLFIGEIIAAYTEESYLTDGNLDIKKIKPILLTMPDNNYWKIGKLAGKAWAAGRDLKS